MDFFEVVKKRRSVRKYKRQSVPEEVIRRALDAALIAPNSSNMQPWEFYWVRTPSLKNALVDACFSQPAAATAEEIIVAVARRDTWRRNQKWMLDHPSIPEAAKVYYRRVVPFVYLHGWFSTLGLLKRLFMTIAGFFRRVPRGPFSHSETMTVLSKTTALACENFMLGIVAQGYGCCPMEGFDESSVKKLLNLNRFCKIVMCISVGVPDPSGIYGPQIRFDPQHFLFEV